MLKHFSLWELVPPSVYNQFGEKSIWFLDPTIVQAADDIREHFGKPMWINNYEWGLTNRGFRRPSANVGAELSQHRFGRAIDFHFDGINTKEAYNELLEQEDNLLRIGVTTLENISYTYDEDTNNKGWIHADCRYTGKDSIKIVTP